MSESKRFHGRWIGMRLAILLLVGCQSTGPAVTAPAPPPPPVALAPAVDGAPAAPAFDRQAALVALGKAHGGIVIPTEGEVPPPPPNPAIARIPSADPACVRPTDAEAAAATAQITAWLAAKFPAEHAHADTKLALALGCVDPKTHALVAGVVGERVGPHNHRRSFVLRLAPGAVAVIAEHDATGVDDLMEYAREDYVAPLALADVDGDGREDVVLERVEHEYRAKASDIAIDVVRATGKTQLVAFRGELDSVKIGPDHQVLVAQYPEPQTIAGAEDTDPLMAGPDAVRCIGPGGTALVDCPAGAAAMRDEARTRVATWFASGHGTNVDRDALAPLLAQAGATPAESAPILDSARPPTTGELATRGVTRLLAAAQPDEPVGPDGMHATARAHFAALTAALGDAPCPAAPLSAAARARAIATVKTVAHGKITSAIDVTPACAPFAFAAWTDAGGGDTVDLLADAKVLVSANVGTLGPNPPPRPLVLPGGFALAGPARAPVAYLVDNGTSHATVFASGAQVAVADGWFEPYTFSAAWPEVAGSIVVKVVDEKRSFFHVTPTGLAPIDPAQLPELATHEARRAALELLGRFDTGGQLPTLRPKYLGALALLGADAALVDIVTRAQPE